MVSIATRYKFLRNKGRPTKSNIAKSEQSSHTPGGHTTLIGKKEKWTNKGTVKHYVAEFFIHSTTCRIGCLYRISKF